MKTYHVKAIWDQEAGVYRSESDVPGLVIEAETLSQFAELAQALVPEMLEANVPGFTRGSASEHPSAAMELAYS